ERGGGAAPPDAQVARLVQGEDVLGVVVQDPQIVLQRLVEPSPRQVLLGGLDDPVACTGHWHRDFNRSSGVSRRERTGKTGSGARARRLPAPLRGSSDGAPGRDRGSKARG